MLIDNLADMVSRIKVALINKRSSVVIFKTKLNLEILDILYVKV